MACLRSFNSNFSSFYVTNMGDIGSNPQSFLPINNKHPIRIVGGPAQTYNSDLIFVSFENISKIDVFDPTSSQVTKTITGLPPNAKVDVMKSFFKY